MTTQAMPTAETEAATASSPSAPAARRRVTAWGLTALLIVLVQVAVRWWSSSGLDSYHDDVNLTYIALDGQLDAQYLLGQYAAHFGPVNRFIMWLVVHGAPFDAGVAYATVIALMVVGDIGMLLALRAIFGARWLTLGLFAFWAFNPVTVVVIGEWSLGLIVVPVLAASAWTVYFHVRTMRDGRVWTSLLALLCAALALLSSPQALFLYPFLLLYSLAYPRVLETGDLKGMVRRSWHLWMGYALVLVAYLALYRSASPTRDTRGITPASFMDTVAGAFFGSALPSLVGGSWGSDPGALPSIAAISGLLISLLFQALLLFVALTIWARPAAWRAWAVLLALVLMLMATLALSVRFDIIGEQLLRQTRYVAVLLVPATVLLGVTVACRPVRESAARLLSGPRRRWVMVAAAVGGIVLLESAWVTTYRLSEAMKTASTRGFWLNVRQDFAAHPDAVIIDRTMPPSVVFAGFLPEVGTASRALRWFVTDQRFSQPSADPYLLTDEGRLVRGHVLEFARSWPGPRPGCGYLVTGGEPVSIPLNKDGFNYSWGVQLNYLAAKDTILAVSGGGVTREVPVTRGPNSVTLELPGILSQVEVSEPGASTPVCVDQVVVGGIVPVSP